MSLSPSEELSFSTVRIECDLASGGSSTGTGFLYALNQTNDKNVPVIVTNKHVIVGAETGRFVMTLQDAFGSPDVGNKWTFTLGGFESRWIQHPDPNIDLCVMPIGPLLNASAQVGKICFYRTLSKELIASQSDLDNMIGLESITMVGYPNGLWDAANNLPIFRRGTLASDYKRDWNGKKEFLIDAACFPGSSGSPVLLFDVGTVYDRKGLSVGASRIKFLGVLYAGPQHTIEGEVKILPIGQKVVAVSGIPNNLGIVIKAEQLNVFETLLGSNP